MYGSQEGRVVIVLPNYQGKPVNDYWFSYPADLDSMVEFAEAKQNSDVWYSPYIYRDDVRDIEHSLTVQIVGADADSCDPNNFRVQPSITVQTSEGHWHTYWVLEEPMESKSAAAISRRIAHAHKHQGCDQAYVHAAKLLRVPDTSNQKHPGAVVIVSDYEPGAVGAAVVEAYPESELPDAIDVTKADMPSDLSEYIEKNRKSLLNGLPNSIGLRELLFGKFQEDKRSDVRWKLLLELYRLGLDDHGVMALAWDTPSNKYRTDEKESRGLRGLWDEAMRAKAHVQLERESYDEYDVPVGEEWEPDNRVQEVKKREPTVFLTPEELESVRELVNFIDEWINWAKTRTDAPIEYHRAAAITLLSIVYGEFGHATPKFGKLKFNMWFMVLGRSTKDRKSTSRKYLNEALRALADEDYQYVLGDDVTPSGVSLVLHDRANRSSIFDRDEVQGFFKEILHQSYMTGGLEVFTKLYDGWSGGRVRASGDKKVLASVPVNFVMFMMGILEESADVLTVSNYKSGFLTRFLTVIADRPEGYKAPPLEQADEDEIGEDDKVFNGLIKHLALNRSWWSMRADRDNGKTYGLRADEDAWARFQQFMEDVDKVASQTSYYEIISTTAERLQISTLKMAGILAMDDRSLTIKLPHMLQAIAYAGEWFDNTVTMASMVSESEWQRDVDKLEQFINSKGGKVSYATAYRQFKDKKPREFEEMLQALESGGKLSRVQAGSRWVLEVSYEE